MTLRHLKIFVTVCETGSGTAAGEKLYIAQPSISLAISELEDYYGVKLFDRIGKRLHITDTGKRFLQYANHVVDLIDEMEKGFKNGDSTGILRIGTSITIGNYLLPQYVKDFKKTHPEISINAIIDNSDTIKQQVLNNSIDIGLIEGNAHNAYIVSEHFREDELVLICGLEHPLADYEEVDVDTIKTEDFILREKGSAGREIFDSIMSVRGITIRPIWESISTQAIVRAVELGLGLSVLPYLLVEEYLENDKIKSLRIKDVSLMRKFSIIYHKNKYITKSAKDFIEMCKQESTG